MQDLELMTLLVVYPGSKHYALAEDIWTVPLPAWRKREQRGDK